MSLSLRERTEVVDIGYLMVDADQHYYETDDCFTRHIEKKYRDRTVEIVGPRSSPRQVMLAGKASSFYSQNPIDDLGRPGALFEYFDQGGGVGDGTTYGETLTVDELPESRDRSAKLRHMDAQRVQAALLFPSLVVGLEYELSVDQPDALGPNLTAFNRWVEDDWGFGSDGRIFGVPLLSLHDLDWAIDELDRVLAAGARVVHLRPGPVDRQWSPADPRFDRFWSRVQEAGVPVAFHLGDSGFCEMSTTLWGEPSRPPFNRYTPFQRLTSFAERPIEDTMAAIITHNLFGRFPDLRVMSIENGCGWVGPLIKKLDRYARMCGPQDWLFGAPKERPSEIFARHVSVSPYAEDDAEALVDLIGAGAVVAGSDYPHPEGLPEPTAFSHKLRRLNDADVRKVMRGNTARLIGVE